MAASTAPQVSKSAQIRARLSHPIIDSDGHCFEPAALFMEYLKATGGASLASRFKTIFQDTFLDPRWRVFSMDERRQRRNLRPTWRAIPAENTLDLATAIMPKLMNERLAEMGLDYSVVYPTLAFITQAIPDEELRRAANRAINDMKADMFRDYSYRLTPVASIPMHTPQEAIGELEHCVKDLGMKTIMVASYVKRPIPIAEEKFPGAGQWAYWMDTLGLDSAHDYDPFWRKCVELKVSPTFHSVGYGWGTRQSISNYIHNHIGNFAASAEAVCKSLLLSGVPKRFPELSFAFLEGGIPWARTLYSDLIGHWDKRHREALGKYSPAKVNRGLFRDLAGRYCDRFLKGREEAVLDSVLETMMAGEDAQLLDEWAPSGVRSPEDIRAAFRDQFWFGCEGDDPLNALAFRSYGGKYELRFNALYGSDIGHWDVPDMAEVAEEAYELVEHEIITPDDLRDFVFINPIRFWCKTNPGFFKGTAVESQVSKVLAEELKWPETGARATAAWDEA